MRVRPFVAMLLLSAGCGGSPHAVKYDSLKNQSQASVFLHHVNFAGEAATRSGISVFISGEGKHPKTWRVSFMLDVERPKGSSSVLGERPELCLPPTFWRKIDALTNTTPWLEGLNDNVTFDIELDDLVAIVESKEFKLNGKPVKLSPEEAEAIKVAVVSARENTAGNE